LASRELRPEAAVRKVFVLLSAVAFVGPAVAQQSYLVEVTAENVAIRGGPSEQMPETGMLFRGTHLTVHHEEPNGWLAVQAPPGQVSWVNHKYLDEPKEVIPRNAVIQSEGDIEIACGRAGHGKPLEIRRSKIPDQTIVLVIGKKAEFNNSWWYPISPPYDDFRYVPKVAVRTLSSQSAPGFVVRVPTQPSPSPVVPAEVRTAFEPSASIPTKPTPKAGKPADWPNHPLWQQAEAAERQSEYARAESLYLKLAAEMNQPGGDAELANLCYARLHAVREKHRPGTKPSSTPARNDLPPTNSSQWVGPGTLRSAGIKFDGRSSFALVNAKNEVKCYVLSSNEVDLERYRNTEVQILGTLSYPGDLRGVGVMTASKISVVRDK